MQLLFLMVFSSVFGPILRCKLSSKMVLMMQMTFINFAKIISTSASSLYVSKYSICFTKLKFLAANLKGQTLEIVPSLAISENQQRQDLIKACIPTTATPALTVLYPAFTQ